MSRIVQLDVVRRGLVGHEEFPGVRLISLVGTDSAVRNAAQVLAVERLEGEPYLFVSSLCHIHLEFLPGEWVTAFEGSHIKILISLEPSLFIGIEEGEPFGVEGSLETPAGSLPLSCEPRPPLSQSTCLRDSFGPPARRRAWCCPGAP